MSDRKVHLAAAIMENDVPMGDTAYCDTALNFPKWKLTKDEDAVTCRRCRKIIPPKCSKCGQRKRP